LHRREDARDGGAGQQGRQQRPVAHDVRAGGGDIGRDRGERQGQVPERGAGPDEVRDDGREPGGGKQVRPGVLQEAGLGKQAAGEYSLAGDLGPGV